MPISAADILRRRSMSGDMTFLKISDLPYRCRVVTLECRALREAPRMFNSPLLLDIGKVYADGELVKVDKTTFPVNITNTRKMGELMGDNLDKAPGMLFEFKIDRVKNLEAKRGDPDEFVDSLILVAVKPPATAPAEAAAQNQKRR